MKTIKSENKFEIPPVDTDLFVNAVKLADKLLGHQFCDDKGLILQQYNELTGSDHTLADFDAEISAKEIVGIDLLPEPEFSFEISEFEYVQMIEVLRTEEDDLSRVMWLQKILVAHHPGFDDIYNRFEYETFPNDSKDIYLLIVMDINQ